MRRVIRDRDGNARSADMRMQPCGHRWYRHSELRQVCLDCEDDEEQRIGTQEMYRRQEGMSG